jgi:hypothetical protein
MHLNVKKEMSWDKAVQLPCVTALTVICPVVAKGVVVMGRTKGWVRVGIAYQYVPRVNHHLYAQSIIHFDRAKMNGWQRNE